LGDVSCWETKVDFDPGLRESGACQHAQTSNRAIFPAVIITIHQRRFPFAKRPGDAFFCCAETKGRFASVVDSVSSGRSRA